MCVYCSLPALMHACALQVLALYHNHLLHQRAFLDKQVSSSVERMPFFCSQSQTTALCLTRSHTRTQHTHVCSRTFFTISSYKVLAFLVPEKGFTSTITFLISRRPKITRQYRSHSCFSSSPAFVWLSLLGLEALVKFAGLSALLSCSSAAALCSETALELRIRLKVKL